MLENSQNVPVSHHTEVATSTFFLKEKGEHGGWKSYWLGLNSALRWGLRRVAHPIPGNIQQHPSQAGWGSEAEDGPGHGRGLDLMTFKSPF